MAPHQTTPVVITKKRPFTHLVEELLAGSAGLDGELQLRVHRRHTHADLQRRALKRQWEALGMALLVLRDPETFYQHGSDAFVQSGNVLPAWRRCLCAILSDLKRLAK